MVRAAGKAPVPVVVTLLALAVGPLWAQPALPPSVVLVLKVLSSTHVRPVTGLVVSADGQVVVPAGFVERGDDIVVLEGGTDLMRNARPTRPVARSAELGLAVLAAEGLRRPAAVLTLDSLETIAALTFVAFPAANELAAGEPPIRTQVPVDLRDGRLRIDGEAQLPEVNGALFDACGYLAGIVLAAAPEAGPASPRPVITQPRLGEILAQLEVSTNARACRSAARADTAAPATEAEDSGGGPQILDPDNLMPAQPDLGQSSPAAITSTDPGSQSDPAPLLPEEQALLVPAEVDPAPLPAPPPEAAQQQGPAVAASGTGSGHATAVLAAVLILVAGLTGWWIGRRGRASPPARDSLRNTVLPGEPGEESSPEGYPTAAGPVVVPVTLQVTYADGREETLAADLSAESAGLLLGRGQADIVIQDPSLSRLHGRLRLADGDVTYTDLGSSRGSWVDGVACLEGETFRLAEASDLVLGQVQLSLSTAGPGGEGR